MKKENNFNHLMVDIETLGCSSYSVILSFSAVEFNLYTGETGASITRHIDLNSCIKAGFLVDASTVIWWMKQSELAREKVTEGNTDIYTALLDFRDFLVSRPDFLLWGNSASFDLGILGNAYDKMAIEKPWKHWNERCLRTLVFLNPFPKQNHKFKGEKHDAFTDCVNQIEYASETVRTLLTEDPAVFVAEEKTEKCYIAGKIGDLPENEYKLNFINAKNEVAALGMIPVSPVDLPHQHDKTWASYMREDVSALLNCTCLYALKNWKYSPGARIEVGLAVQLGMKIIYQS